MEKIVTAGDFNYQVIDGMLHQWPRNGNAADFGGPQRVKTQDFGGLPKEVLELVTDHFISMTLSDELEVERPRG